MPQLQTRLLLLLTGCSRTIITAKRPGLNSISARFGQRGPTAGSIGGQSEVPGPARTTTFAAEGLLLLLLLISRRNASEEIKVASKRRIT